VLIIEDARRLRESLADGLRAAGYAVDMSEDGVDGLARARGVCFDAIVLDLMLPGMDGLAVLEKLRSGGGAVCESASSPVLILSAKDRVEHRVEGLRRGADDYLVKPFAFEELLARLTALCRRSRGVASATVRIGGVCLDMGARRFQANGREIRLTRREYTLLEYLFVNAGRVVSRSELEEHLYSADSQVWSNAVDAAVAAVRRKLRDVGASSIVHTRRGRGYMVDARAESQGLTGGGDP
jgi:DNA-binding response OmpR family regulator